MSFGERRLVLDVVVVDLHLRAVRRVSELPATRVEHRQGSGSVVLPLSKHAKRRNLKKVTQKVSLVTDLAVDWCPVRRLTHFGRVPAPLLGSVEAGHPLVKVVLLRMPPTLVQKGNELARGRVRARQSDIALVGYHLLGVVRVDPACAFKVV